MGKEDYKNEKKGHGFLCVPKELLFDNRYKQLTIEAILLYAYMLDRLKLSIENGWKDSDGKVFIYFSLESIRYVLFILKNNKKKINNIKQYLLTVLFNAPATCCSFFQNQTFDK